MQKRLLIVIIGICVIFAALVLRAHAAPLNGCKMTERGRYICLNSRRALAPWAHGRRSRIVPNPPGCPPVRFCGCGASLRVFGKRIKKLYRAAEWLKFPRARPGPMKAAARRHHVMVILDYLGHGMAKVYDANSGHHKTRIHVVSLRGFTVVDPQGATP